MLLPIKQWGTTLDFDTLSFRSKNNKRLLEQVEAEALESSQFVVFISINISGKCLYPHIEILLFIAHTMRA